MGARKIAVGILAAIGVAACLAFLAFAASGLSARRPPHLLEVRLARAGRHLLVPASARRQPNPVALDADVIRAARDHFADHCATCHGNDGRGDTPYGRNLSPRVPDLTAKPTQGLTDGELFYFIEQGIRLTGMPAFGDGTPESERESWELVHFIRRLPRITDAELAEMRRLNPMSRAEFEQELAAEAFLRGAMPRPVAEEPQHHHH